VECKLQIAAAATLQNPKEETIAAEWATDTAASDSLTDPLVSLQTNYTLIFVPHVRNIYDVQSGGSDQESDLVLAKKWP
jgi:hypothetical protein